MLLRPGRVFTFEDVDILLLCLWNYSCDYYKCNIFMGSWVQFAFKCSFTGSHV